MVKFSEPRYMADLLFGTHAYIEVVFNDRPRRLVPLDELPFFIGRGTETGNHLALDHPRVSRKCLVISAVPGGFGIEDRGQRGGVFINGQQITEGHILSDGDRIRLGTEGACQLIFRSSSELLAGNEEQAQLECIVSPGSGDSRYGLDRLTLLLEAMSLLHSQLPLDSIFATMLDHAIAITDADRGMLLEPDGAGSMHVKVARGRERKSLPPEAMNPSYQCFGKPSSRDPRLSTRTFDLPRRTFKPPRACCCKTCVRLWSFRCTQRASRGTPNPGWKVGASCWELFISTRSD